MFRDRQTDGQSQQARYVYLEGDRQNGRRQIDGRIDRQIDGWIDGKIDRQMDKELDRYIDGRIDRQMDRQIHRWKDRQKDRQIDGRDFQEPKTDMKQMNCYQNDLTIKPLSNYYVFSKIFEFEILVFN